MRGLRHAAIVALAALVLVPSLVEAKVRRDHHHLAVSRESTSATYQVGPYDVWDVYDVRVDGREVRCEEGGSRITCGGRGVLLSVRAYGHVLRAVAVSTSGRHNVRFRTLVGPLGDFVERSHGG